MVQAEIRWGARCPPGRGSGDGEGRSDSGVIASKDSMEGGPRIQLKACPRCGGDVHGWLYEPACLQCGWVDYRKPKPVETIVWLSLACCSPFAAFHAACPCGPVLQPWAGRVILCPCVCHVDVRPELDPEVVAREDRALTTFSDGELNPHLPPRQSGFVRSVLEFREAQRHQQGLSQSVPE